MLKVALTEFTFIMNNSSLIDKMGVLSFFFLLYIKNEWHGLLSEKQRSNTE